MALGRRSGAVALGDRGHVCKYVFFFICFLLYEGSAMRCTSEV